MKTNARLSLKSYDRMFPNQDTLPAGGFGNLIALPLQRKAAKSCGGSMFIDQTGAPYPDQWAFLASVQRMTPSSVDAAILSLGVSPLGTLITDSDDQKPWKMPDDHIPATDHTRSFNCVIADRIYIDTADVSSFVQNCLKRLAAFRNPKFYQLQAMRMPVWNTPRIICCAEYIDNYLCLPRGCADSLNQWAEVNGITVNWRDEQATGKHVRTEFRGSLHPEQKIALQVLEQYDKGVLSATTAFGKTVIGAALIARKQVSTLILVHRQQLMTQWKERMEQFLEIQESIPEPASARGRKKTTSVIGLYGAGNKTRTGIIDIAMIQSIASQTDIPSWIGDYGLIIVDECHHVPAVSFEAVLRSVRAKYTYGLTATPTRKDGHHPIINMYLGGIRYQVSAKEQAAMRPFIHIMVPRFTGTVFPEDSGPGSYSIAAYYWQIAEDEIRNHMIVDDVLSCIREKRNCLVLSERTAHVMLLAELIRKKYDTVFVLLGGQTNAQTGRLLSEIRAVTHDRPIVICATGKYIGEGFDESRLDTLFLTMPISWHGILAQYVGRLHRLYAGKREVRVYDYIDDQANMLERMYVKRLRGYASLGYHVSSEHSDTHVTSDIIYDQKTFIAPFCQDLHHAKHMILIVSPYLTVKRVKWFLNALQSRSYSIHIRVITRPPQSFGKAPAVQAAEDAIHLLQNSGTEVLLKDAIHQKFAVFDEKTVWYGSINLLSFGASEESVIRLVTGSVADTLMRSIGIASPSTDQGSIANVHKM